MQDELTQVRFEIERHQPDAETRARLRERLMTETVAPEAPEAPGRRGRARRMLRVTAMAVAGLAIVTGIAAAADDRVASALHHAASPISQVFDGPPASEPVPTDATDAFEFMDNLRDELRGSAPRASNGGKVLLHESMDGSDIEIVAIEGTPKPRAGSTTPPKPETCFSVLVDGRSQGVTCSPEFMPEAAVNYAVGYEIGPEGFRSATIHGLVGNGVEAVDVVTSHGTEAALLGDHAFYWKGSHAPPVAVEIVTDSGQRIRTTRLLEDNESLLRQFRS